MEIDLATDFCNCRHYKYDWGKALHHICDECTGPYYKAKDGFKFGDDPLPMAPILPAQRMAGSPPSPAAVESDYDSQVHISKAAWPHFRAAVENYVEGLTIKSTAELKKLQALLRLYP